MTLSKKTIEFQLKNLFLEISNYRISTLEKFLGKKNLEVLLSSIKGICRPKSSNHLIIPLHYAANEKTMVKSNLRFKRTTFTYPYLLILLKLTFDHIFISLDLHVGTMSRINLVITSSSCYQQFRCGLCVLWYASNHVQIHRDW